MTHDALCPCATHKSPHIQHLSGVCHYCQCNLIAKVRADELRRPTEDGWMSVRAVLAWEDQIRDDERSRIADAVAEQMIAHPYEYPSDYAEVDREWIKAGCPDKEQSCRSRRGLTRRRSEIYRELMTTPQALDAKARSTEPLTDAEFSAIQELRDISFLLGEH